MDLRYGSLEGPRCSEISPSVSKGRTGRSGSEAKCWFEAIAPHGVRTSRTLVHPSICPPVHPSVYRRSMYPSPIRGAVVSKAPVTISIIWRRGFEDGTIVRYILANTEVL